MGRYEEITKARQILGLYEFAILKNIKNKYKELLKEWHPDLCIENEEIEKYISADEFWEKRFRSDPIGSNYNDEEQD